MHAFILGAGASLHVGYPLSMNLGRSVIKWAANNPRPDPSYWIDPSRLSAIFDQPSLDDFEGIITELENPRVGSHVSTLEPSERVNSCWVSKCTLRIL